MAGPRCTKAEAVRACARILAAAHAHMATLTAEEAAREAYIPGGPTVEELAAEIRRRRAQSARTAA